MEGPDKGPTPVAPTNALNRQDQLDADHLNGPGFGIEDQKPGFFDNALGAPGRGLGQAGADVYGVLAHGLSSLFEPVDTPVVVGDGTVLPPATDETDKAWHPAADALEQVAKDAHEYSKSLMPDPRVTGAGANIIQGLTKGAGEFIAGGGGLGGAALLGTAEGRASYLDLLDEGVDPDTALKSAALTGTLSAGAAFLPMSLPAKALATLSRPAALLVQAGVGATVNTAFGIGQRYASAKILEDAGYAAQADQIKPWDSLNLATDFLTGSVFGIHSGWHGIKAAEADAGAQDAARAVQDRQATLDRAPGVPVDTASMAVHRESLEKALSDLMQNKPVDLDDQAAEGGLFARPEEDTAEARQIIHDQFMESGVIDDAEQFDRFLRGEDLTTPKPPPKPEPAPEAQVAPAEDHPDNDTVNQLVRDKEDEDGSVVSEQVLRDKPDLKVVDEEGAEKSAAEAHQEARNEEARANEEAETMHRAAVECESRYA